MSTAPVNRGCTTMRSPVERSTTTSFARRHARAIVAPVTRRTSCAAVTARTTSGFVIRAPMIVRPRNAASRSRAIVSVSGSSGTAVQLAPSDVGADLLVGKVDAGRVIGAELLGFGDGRRESGHGQYATPGAH